MLCQFSFGNYKVFKDEVLLDLFAETVKEHKESLIIDERDQEKFIPVVVIYGPNAGGKSTVLEALDFLRFTVVKTIAVTKMHEQDDKYTSVLKKFESETFKDRYHKFSAECKDKPTSFDLLFRRGERQFRYQLSLLYGKVIEENLYVQTVGEKKVTLVFERSEEECILGEDIEDISVEKVSNTMPLLTHICMNYDIEVIDIVVDWFFDIEIINYDNPRKERNIIIPKVQAWREKLFCMLKEMDIQIEDVRVEKDIDGNIQNIYTKHRTQEGTVCEIPFEEESSGTRKLFSCLATIISCLSKGNLLVVDELDAKLHPKILQYIIELFTNPESNRKGAQLLLTSHDITTMNSRVFRRDEIWFCAKNPLGASKLYSLATFRKENGSQIRNDEAYGKRYLEGRYGADPYIRKILDWEDDE